MANQINHPDFDTKILRVNNSNKKVEYLVSHDKKIDKQVEDGNFTIKKYETNFIRKIQDYRREHRLTQQEFAQKLQIPLQVIRGIESNTLSYNSCHVQKINNFINKSAK